MDKKALPLTVSLKLLLSFVELLIASKHISVSSSDTHSVVLGTTHQVKIETEQEEKELPSTEEWIENEMIKTTIVHKKITISEFKHDNGIDTPFNKESYCYVTKKDMDIDFPVLLKSVLTAVSGDFNFYK